MSVHAQLMQNCLLILRKLLSSSSGTTGRALAAPALASVFLFAEKGADSAIVLSVLKQPPHIARVFYRRIWNVLLPVVRNEEFDHRIVGNIRSDVFSTVFAHLIGRFKTILAPSSLEGIDLKSMSVANVQKDDFRHLIAAIVIMHCALEKEGLSCRCIFPACDCMVTAASIPGRLFATLLPFVNQVEFEFRHPIAALVVCTIDCVSELGSLWKVQIEPNSNPQQVRIGEKIPFFFFFFFFFSSTSYYANSLAFSSPVLPSSGCLLPHCWLLAIQSSLRPPWAILCPNY
jgi:hypothetical protein